jgi:AcrR family transcriptional regulator
MLGDEQATIKPQAVGRKPMRSRRERHRAETRARILQAALSLFAGQGFAATRVEQITEAADVGKGTFFNYFPTKEHVLAGFAGRQIGKIQVALEKARQGAEPLRELLFRLLLSLENEPGLNPELTRSLLVALLSSQAVRELAKPNLERGRRLLAEIFALGQQRGEIRADAKHNELARFFQLSAFGTMFLWSLHPAPKLAEWQRSGFELVWSALEAKPKSRTKEVRP